MKKLKPGAVAQIDPVDASASSGSIMSESDDQKKLRALVERRHPEYEENYEHWRFMSETYEGGREWFEKHLFQYVKEGEREFAARKKRAYRFNHSREVVDLLNKYLFKQNIARNEKDAPQSIKDFWKKATLNGLGIKDLSRQISKKTSISGRIGIVIDRTTADAQAVSIRDQKKAGGRTYAYIVGPEQLLDYSFDDAGSLEWVLIKEVNRDDSDPINSSGREEDQFRLWTKTEWKLYKEKTVGRKKIIYLDSSGVHDLGVVPVVLADNVITDEEYCSPALIGDISYLDRAVANYLSNLDAIIQDQTFSQLVMPAQNLLPGEDSYNKMTEMSTKRVFLYDGEGGNAPSYISPDPKQAQMILAAINKIINEIYHTVGLAGERTKQDNAVGIDNSSGVAKAFDFERVNALLASKADALEVVENKIVEIVAKWNDDALTKGDLVSYPDNFDTRGLYDEFDIAARLMLIGAPEEVRREQMQGVLDKLFPQLDQETRSKLDKSVKTWDTDPLEATADPKKPAAKATKKPKGE